MIVGVMVLDLRSGNTHSLKDKRQLVRSLKEKLRRRFNVAVIESGHQDSWQQAQISLVTIALDQGLLDRIFSRIEVFIEESYPMFAVSVDREYL